MTAAHTTPQPTAEHAANHARRLLQDIPTISAATIANAAGISTSTLQAILTNNTHHTSPTPRTIQAVLDVTPTDLADAATATHHARHHATTLLKNRPDLTPADIDRTAGARDGVTRILINGGHVGPSTTTNARRILALTPQDLPDPDPTTLRAHTAAVRVQELLHTHPHLTLDDIAHAVDAHTHTLEALINHEDRHRRDHIARRVLDLDPTTLPTTTLTQRAAQARTRINRLTATHPHLTSPALASTIGVTPNALRDLLNPNTTPTARTVHQALTFDWRHLDRTTLPKDPTPACIARPGTGGTACRCSQACIDRARAADAARRARKQKGQAGSFDGTIIAARLDALRAARPDVTDKHIADAAHISPNTLRNITTGATRVVHRGVAERIYALTPNDLPTPNTDTRLVDPGQARIWLDSLTALGWSRRVIAERAGLHREVIVDAVLRRPGKRITVDTAQRVWRVYQELKDTPAPHEGTHGRAPTERDRIAARRKLDALMALGWTRQELNRRHQVTNTTIQQASDPRLTPTSLGRINTAFTALSARRGPGNTARAAGMGLVPPAAWDGNSIEDPHARPDFKAIPDPAWRARARDRYRDPAMAGLLYPAPTKKKKHP